MSTGTKRPHAEALADAKDFRAMLDSCAAKWHIAGSLRRNKPEVGDVEHVIIPAFGDSPSAGLFGQTERINLLWQRLDALVASGELQRALYTDKNGAVTQRWGEKLRAVTYRGMKHELYTATAENFGNILLIRTGPDSYSQKVVDALLRGRMYRQQDGLLVHVASGEVVPAPDEETYLKFAGMTWCPPEDRT